jgi:uncharacterized membrane protein YgdD (TMEM256/DUF423 family)
VNRRFLALAGIAGALGVATGALGSHALRSRLDASGLLAWETAVRYHLVHALALGLVALLLERRPSRRVAAAGFLFAAGIVLFCGSLYALALSAPRWIGPITPIGGLSFLAGWVCLALAGLGRPRAPNPDG